jgi:tetratricopeptide (TPR) repeat protein
LDYQIVSLLQEIRSELWILIIIVGLFFVAKAIKGSDALFRTMKKRFDERFKIIARCMFDRGQFDSLLKYCDEQEKKNPRDGYPFWFRGQVYYELKEYDKARENFSKVIEIYPSWEKEWVGPYIEKMDAKNKSSLTDN